MTKSGEHESARTDRAPAKPVWLLWLIPLAGLVALAWFILRGDRSTDHAPYAPAVIEAEQASPQ